MPSGTPIATYRLQLTANFDFDAAAAIVPYLKALGISHVYASPFTKARKGSTHGYDVVNHTLINPELGGDEGFERLSAILKAHDLGLILDFVPNHVGVHFADNPWWLDTLEWGPASAHASAFDIDWDLLPHRKRGGVLLPILGSSYGEALERGKIELRYEASEGSFSCWHFEHRLPIAPERYGEVLRTVVKEADAETTEAGKCILALASRYHGLRHPNRQEAPQFKDELKDIAGGAEIIAAFGAKDWKRSLLWGLLGALYIAAGVITILNPFAAATILTLFLGFALVFGGMCRAKNAADAFERQRRVTGLVCRRDFRRSRRALRAAHRQNLDLARLHQRLHHRKRSAQHLDARFGEVVRRLHDIAIRHLDDLQVHVLDPAEQ